MVLAAYLSLALSGALAARQSRGWLRCWITWDVVMTVALKLVSVLISHPRTASRAYKVGWMFGEPIGVVLVALAVLQLAGLHRVPFWTAPALAVQVWVFSFPDRWPGQWLQFEMHTVAFCYLVLGLSLVPAVRRPVQGALCAFLLGTAAMYYPAPWSPFVREWLMWWQCGCYLVMAAASSRQR